jgi:hypothetical protein
MVNADGVTDLIAGIVLQAVEDARSGYCRQDRPCPVTFLEAAGLMVDGQLDPRFETRRTRSGRPSNYGLGQPKHTA